ncbi:hypothetical protein OA92_10020 [Marinomonas sp. SBI22]|uniref:hypothetical protein n=1 Tax=unclassified Marinomonas TaxID=196814 RepID=UPI0007AFA62C|nr:MULTISPECIES: hypothetical protein [unclassified Marinomonas]KZM43087.1 hypothetical protein OA92_10020 [Marinomonas sp. SBI22]KZM44658.1 hypothetical protein OA91_09445 [Marinomonas sp. SBI8L]
MIEITRCAWDENTPDKLRGACGEWADITRSNVEKGIEQLHHITGSNVDVWAVTRGEVAAHGSELVICYVGGKGMREAGFALKNAAIKQGFKTIRYHTTEPAIHRLYQMYGFAGEEVERVYRLSLGGGHG